MGIFRLAAVMRVQLLVILSLAPCTFSQEPAKRLGEIDFFGYAGLDRDRVRAALPIREGEFFTPSEKTVLEMIAGIQTAVKNTTGSPATDVAVACCDSDGNFMIYIGLSGNSRRGRPYNPVPQGKKNLPAAVVNLYQQANELSSLLVQEGKMGEDVSQGYALSTDPKLRAIELNIRAFALQHRRLLSRTLRTSRDANQRMIAVRFLGYARQSSSQIADLVWASHDANAGVRNDAIRALGVLAKSSQKIAGQIPADGFVEMLSSGSWTDRNKAGYLLGELSRNRNPKLLRLLRSRALDSLIEMARWRSALHAVFARSLLGRIAGIREEELARMADAVYMEKVIRSLQTR